MMETENPDFDHFNEKAAEEPTINFIQSRQAHFLKELVVPVSVYFGEIKLSAAELLDLAGGEVFEFQFDCLEELPLRIGAEVVAYGRLIEKDSSLALEVTRLPDKGAVEKRNSL